MSTIIVHEDKVRIIREEPPGRIVRETATAVRTLAVARQGPPGPPGPRGPAGQSVVFAVGPEVLSGHSCVAVNSDGHLVKADCTDPSHLGTVLGLIPDSHSPGEEAVVMVSYTLEHLGWSWTPGPVFVGSGGHLVQSLPPGAVFSQVVAQALSATRILIDPQPPISIA